MKTQKMRRRDAADDAREGAGQAAGGRLGQRLDAGFERVDLRLRHARALEPRLDVGPSCIELGVDGRHLLHDAEDDDDADRDAEQHEADRDQHGRDPALDVVLREPVHDREERTAEQDREQRGEHQHLCRRDREEEQDDDDGDEDDDAAPAADVVGPGGHGESTGPVAGGRVLRRRRLHAVVGRRLVRRHPYPPSAPADRQRISSMVTQGSSGSDSAGLLAPPATPWRGTRRRCRPAHALRAAGRTCGASARRRGGRSPCSRGRGS